MSLFDRAKNILLTPANEWGVIKTETATVKDLFMKYAIVLAAVPAVAGFIGFSFFGISWGFGSYGLSIGFSLKWAIVTYLLNLVGVFVVALIMDTLAPNFGSSKDMVSSMKVVVYAYTASWVGGVFNIFPSLSLIGGLAGIYSLFLMYQGMKIVKQVSQDKLVGYFVAVIIAAIVVYAVTGWIVTAFTFGGVTTLMNPY
jgi:hypothetical protein